MHSGTVSFSRQRSAAMPPPKLASGMSRKRQTFSSWLSPPRHFCPLLRPTARPKSRARRDDARTDSGSRTWLHRVRIAHRLRVVIIPVVEQYLPFVLLLALVAAFAGG